MVYSGHPDRFWKIDQFDFNIGRLEEAMKKLSTFALFVLCVIPLVVAKAGLPFIQDNYGAALSEAKQRNVPIFVEVWAPW
jgi:hypothetical protein